MSLDNITQFAPSLLKKTTKIGKDVVKVEYPMIKVPNVTIKKIGGKREFVEDYGKFGFFEFKPDTIKSELRVNITTQSTKSALKTLEKNSYTQFIANLGQIAMIKPEILQMVSADDIWTLTKLTYGYDDQLTAKTKKDQIKAENLKKIEAIKQMANLP